MNGLSYGLGLADSWTLDDRFVDVHVFHEL